MWAKVLQLGKVVNPEPMSTVRADDDWRAESDPQSRHAVRSLEREARSAGAPSGAQYEYVGHRTEVAIVRDERGAAKMDRNGAPSGFRSSK